MVKLIAKSPFDGALPKTIGTVTLSEVEIGNLFSVFPFARQTKPVSEALKTQLGAGLPEVGNSIQTDGARVFWAGHGSWMVTGNPKLSGLAAVSDQSDAWVAVQIEGEAVLDVLARLVPIDLRPTAFPNGRVARTMLGHMNVIILSTGPSRFEIMGFRSMTGTMLHELTRAANAVAARQAGDVS